MESILDRLQSTPLVIATSNTHKLNEWNQILGLFGTFNTLSLKEANIQVTPPMETGSSFQSNASIKSIYYSAHSSYPVLSDDSGLTVPDLNGEPGIYSARYAGEQASDHENLELLLANIQKRGLFNPSAYFTCAISIAASEKLLYEAEGQVLGYITHQRHGAHGFGYDPVFYYPPFKMTLSEMETSQKNKISHRFNALKSLFQHEPTF